MTVSSLVLAPLHRPGSGTAGGPTVSEWWSWDFVVDGRPLSSAISADVAGALGWGDEVWESGVHDNLLARTAPDVPPDRIALYICPECGDLSCGAVTAALAMDGDTIEWRDFRWERDWEGAPDTGTVVRLGPFRFDRSAYVRLLRAAAAVRPGPGVAPLAAS